MKKYAIITAIIIAALFIFCRAAFAGDVGQGTLQIIDKKGAVVGECPLKHTDVVADISGFITKVKVTQEFQNPSKGFIEAVYIFPLPQNSAVDSMTMKIGDRIVKGIIKKKEEARKIYEDAKNQGKSAALLDQERPNIFTQSVANIPPGKSIIVEITYVETLAYTDGTYEFVFPMVVGPRYMPGKPVGKKGTGWSPDTNKVPDASKISPPVTPEGTRAGHDINVTVNLNAGMQVQSLKSVLHRINIVKESDSKVKITLDKQDRIPNKDFILQYKTAGENIEEAVLTHGEKGTGYFTMIIQPPARPKQSQITPKEMYFVIDSSGSQMGWPIEKAKETMRYCIENMNPDDTFQVLSFSNEVTPCFESPRPNTAANREAAERWLANTSGAGGTEMMKAIDYSLGAKPDPQRMRIVVFMTDGYVGNDMAILDAIKKNIGSARIFPFGTGNSVNRYLLEGMAKMGKGEVEWVTLNRHADEVAETFQNRIGNPILLDIDVDWANAPVTDVYPEEIPDMFSGKPIVIKGRYTKPFSGEITLKGKSANQPYARKIKVTFPENNAKNEVVGTLWARTKIEDLMNRDLTGIQEGNANEKIKNEITNLGLQFNLMTQFTSFVAVEEKVVNKGGKVTTVAVPVEMPQGVSYDGVFGKDKAEEKCAMQYNSPAPAGGSMASTRACAAPPNASAPPIYKKSSAKLTPSIAYFANEDDEYGGQSAVNIKPEDKIDKNLKSAVKSTNREDVRVILMLTHISEKALAELKKSGFEVSGYSKDQKIVTGTVKGNLIMTIAKLNFVEKIEPDYSGTSQKTTKITMKNTNKKANKGETTMAGAFAITGTILAGIGRMKL